MKDAKILFFLSAYLFLPLLKICPAVPGRIMAPVRPQEPQPCDLVVNVEIKANNEIELKDRYYDDCQKPMQSSNPRRYTVIYENSFPCGTSFIAGAWTKYPYLQLNDYRKAPVDKCFVSNPDVRFPLVSDLSFEEGHSDGSFTQYLSLSVKTVQ